MATMKTLNGYGFNATELNGKSPEYYIQPRNLLDNSDLGNPVNQRGQSSYTGEGYAIDRWRCTMASGTTTYTVGGILQLGKGYGQFVQVLPKHYEGKALTFAVYLSDVSSVDIIVIINDGSSQSVTQVHQGLNIVTHTVRSDATTLFVGLQNNSQSSDQNCTPVWAALYEGSYTAETLPPYVPKGYAAELAECQRYYELVGIHKYSIGRIGEVYFDIQFTQKRISPTVTMALDMASNNIVNKREVWAANLISAGGLLFYANDANVSYWYGSAIVSADL